MKRINLQLVIFFLSFGLFFIPNSNAATINAASCSITDVKTAINSAISGDTVVVPSGSCTWSSYIEIPDSKKITIQGAGKDSTVITRTPVSGLFVVFILGRSGSRITGFGFVDGNIWADGNDFRIDHCSLSFSSWSDGISIASRNVNPAVIPTGVIDNCVFNNMRILVNGTNFLLSENGAQHGLWASDLELGSTKAVYIEGNTFTNGTNAVDGNYGGRYVFRYNTLINTSIEAHSVQSSQNRAIRKWEIYRNNLSQSSGFRYIFLRGGTGVVFDNTVTSGTVSFNLDNVRTFEADGPGLCDGNIAGWDQNTPGQAGWRCRDQIGVGGDTVQWVDNSPATNTQYAIPGYFWGNYRNGSAWTANVVNGCDNHIQNNRDYYDFVASGFNGTSGTGVGTLANRPVTCTTGVGYWATDQGSWNNSGSGGQGVLYKCTATNTWTVYYTPFTYPHPLTKGVDDPRPPSNLRIIE